MKKKLLISSVFFVITGIALEGFYSQVYTFPNGAPDKVSGSPADGKTCTSCHAGTATTKAGLITSNAGPGGYDPGKTYTITATVSYAGRSKFGFEVSPQSQAGALQGTMVVTNSTATQLVGSNKYITHKSAGTTGTDSKTWTFNWIAPAKGTGTVTFYGAFMASNNNGATTGDIVYTSTLTIPENITTGMEDQVVSGADVRIYPIPAKNHLTIEYTLAANEKVEVLLSDLQGRLAERLFSGVQHAGVHKSSFSLKASHASGQYLVSIMAGKTLISKKITLQD